MEKYMNNISAEAEVMDRSFFHLTLDPKKVIFALQYSKSFFLREQPYTGAESAGRSLESECSTISRYMKYELKDYSVICRCRFDAVDADGDPVIVGTATQHNPSK